MKKIRLSIIIPFIKTNLYLKKNLQYFEKIYNQFSDFEIILLPNKIDEYLKGKANIFKYISVIPTKISNPSVKRNVGVQSSRGEFLVFIDDDAYPDKSYLKIIENNIIRNPSILAFGGPSLLPKEQKNEVISVLSDMFFQNPFGGGNNERYLVKKNIKYVKDWPSVNFVIQKKLFIDLGMFNKNYYPGEDTEFCKRLDNSGYKIGYLPDAFVYHFRRDSLMKHLLQIYRYGYYRSKYIFSNKVNLIELKYFAPTFFFTFLICLSIYDLKISTAFILLYFFMILIGYFFVNGLKLSKFLLPLLPFSLLSHFSYALGVFNYFFKK